MTHTLLKQLDLFSGIGGISLALQPWCDTVAYCEIEPYCQQVLTERMRDGSLARSPIFGDVTTLKGTHLNGTIDIITGGFPCQDISVAGMGEGLAGKRSGLFYEIVRLASELAPSFIFLENVSAITSRGGTAVIGALTEIGYDCRWTTLSAQAVGANHKRERWWLLAKRVEGWAGADSQRLRCNTGAWQGVEPFQQTATRAQPGVLCPESPEMGDPYHDGHTPPEIRESPVEGGDRYTPKQKQTQQLEGSGKQHGDVAYSNSPGCEELNTPSKSEDTGYGSRGITEIWSSVWWAAEPDVGPVAHGVPRRMDRIKALGNAVVPLQARVAFEYLLKRGADMI